MTEHELDDFFSAARQERPVPSGNLITRVVADAEAEYLHRSKALTTANRTVSKRSGPNWFHIFAGGGAAAGLLSATLVGLWLGFAQPVPVAAITQSLEDAIGMVSETDPVELIPLLDPFSLEG